MNGWHWYIRDPLRPITKHFKSVKISLKVEINKRGEVEYTYISFIGKGQLPLVMVIREYIANGEIVWADCLKIIG